MFVVFSSPSLFFNQIHIGEFLSDFTFPCNCSLTALDHLPCCIHASAFCEKTGREMLLVFFFTALFLCSFLYPCHVLCFIACTNFTTYCPKSDKSWFIYFLIKNLFWKEEVIALLPWPRAIVHNWLSWRYTFLWILPFDYASDSNFFSSLTLGGKWSCDFHQWCVSSLSITKTLHEKGPSLLSRRVICRFSSMDWHLWQQVPTVLAASVALQRI